METRRLTGTDLWVSELGLGTSEWGLEEPQDLRAACRLIDEACDGGISLFDTAFVYGEGRAEVLLQAALAAKGDPTVTIITKIGPPRRGEPLSVLEDRLQACRARLKRDCLDVVLLHDPHAWQVRRPDIEAAFASFVDRGLARYVGVSGIDAETAEAALVSPTYKVLHLRYNMLDQEYVARFGEQCRAKNVALVIREPLANGYLGGRYTLGQIFPAGDVRSSLPIGTKLVWLRIISELKARLRPTRPLAEAAVRFCLDQDHADAVICGARTPSQLRELIASASSPPLSSSEMRTVYETLMYRSAAPRRSEADEDSAGDDRQKVMVPAAHGHTQDGGAHGHTHD